MQTCSSSRANGWRAVRGVRWMQLERLTPRALRGAVAAIAIVVAIIIPLGDPVEIRFVVLNGCENPSSSR